VLEVTMTGFIPNFTINGKVVFNRQNRVFRRPSKMLADTLSIVSFNGNFYHFLRSIII
jgi:hypothetical protein